MPTPILIGPSCLAEFAETCANALLAGEKYPFIFPTECTLQHWPVPEIKAANEQFLKSLIHRANVYALFVRPSGRGENWRAVYVGERKSAGLRGRITEHMIDKDDRTGSMLEAVKTAVGANQEIGIAVIKVLPESLRLFVEETIIAKYRDELPWNTHR